MFTNQSTQFEGGDTWVSASDFESTLKEIFGKSNASILALAAVYTCALNKTLSLNQFNDYYCNIEQFPYSDQVQDGQRSILIYCLTYIHLQFKKICVQEIEQNDLDRILLTLVEKGYNMPYIPLSFGTNVLEEVHKHRMLRMVCRSCNITTIERVKAGDSFTQLHNYLHEKIKSNSGFEDYFRLVFGYACVDYPDLEKAIEQCVKRYISNEYNHLDTTIWASEMNFKKQFLMFIDQFNSFSQDTPL